MKEFFQPNGPVYRVLERIWNLLVLNLCMLVTSLPILTIGVSLTSAHSVCFKLIEKDDTRVFKNYFGAFYKNFKQSFIFGACLVLILGIVTVDIFYFFKIKRQLSWEIVGILIVACFAIVSSQFLFGYIARYEDRFTIVWMNSAKLFLSHLGIGILMLAMDVFIVIAMLASTQLFVFTIYISAFIGLAFYVFLKSLLILSVFKKHEKGTGPQGMSEFT